ncbi:MAG: DUF2796 domain-containing protein [Aliishimia sp.]
MKPAISLIALVAAFPTFAEDTRELDAHEHGVGTLNIAIEGTTVAMAFEAPGADIVGFEYAAESDADLAAIDAAIATLGAPLDLFVLPNAAGCSVVEARAELESEDDHDDHGDEGHDDHDDHDDHDKDEAHDDHGHKDHADENHDDHAEEDHDDHEHDDHGDKDHADHADEAGHTEFHAEYTLACDAPDALTEISFAYFEAFPNALEVEVQIITTSGAQAFEVERDAPVLDLGR